jgi:hypothetical protein
MNEFDCAVCGRPGMDGIGHFHNELARHEFVSEHFVVLTQLLANLRWVYEWQ